MDVDKLLTELEQERKELDRAILALERLIGEKGKTRTRSVVSISDVGAGHRRRRSSVKGKKRDESSKESTD